MALLSNKLVKLVKSVKFWCEKVSHFAELSHFAALNACRSCFVGLEIVAAPCSASSGKVRQAIQLMLPKFDVLDLDTADGRSMVSLCFEVDALPRPAPSRRCPGARDTRY